MSSETSADAFDDDRDAPAPPTNGDAAPAVDGMRPDAMEMPEELEHRISDLEDELEEKEQLIRALTERLEQAAEQLDRLHRNGADRKRVIGSGGGGGGLPVELVEEQRELVTNLGQAIEQWQEMQAEAALGRIEMELHELRELFEQRLPEGGVLPSATSAPATPGPSPSPKATSPGSSYESMKAAMFADDDTAGHAAAHTPETPIHGDAPPASHLSETFEDEEQVDVPPPAGIDLDTASRSELVEAVTARDEYVATLIRKLRIARKPQLATPDWDSLQDAPDELCTRLMKLEKLLQETSKQAEVEISVERARLGRERMRLAMQQEELQRKLLSPQAEAGEDADGNLDRSDRRWMKFLGGK